MSFSEKIYSIKYGNCLLISFLLFLSNPKKYKFKVKIRAALRNGNFPHFYVIDKDKNVRVKFLPDQDNLPIWKQIIYHGEVLEKPNNINKK